MNTQELVAEIKLRIDDEIAPRIFKDADILLALNDAQNEFALRTLCLFDGGSQVAVKAQSPWVDLPEGTCWITAAWLSSEAVLRLVTQHELEFGYFELNGVETTMRQSDWRMAEGTPTFLVTDLGLLSVRLVPRPLLGDSLFIERYRLPVTLVLAGTPEIPVLYHRDLIIGALAYLYDIPDTETYDKNAAVLKQNMWERRLVIAEQLLQTALRISVRAIPPPPGSGFVQPPGNTIGATQNVNTET